MAVPAFSLTAPRYDMDTFYGRLRHFARQIDPRQMLRTTATIRRSEKMLSDFKQDPKATRERLGDKELWKSRSIVESCVHPATKTDIFPLFRMAAFIPVNTFIIPFMIHKKTVASPARTIFIHWFNQSYNVAVNYANRSSDSVPMKALAQSYVAAVSLSLVLGLGGTYMANKVNPGTTAALIVRSFLPFAAVSVSSATNVAITRRQEWLSGPGVEVKDKSGKVWGRSLVAGRDAVAMCGIVRFEWNILPMIVPPLLMSPIAASLGIVAAAPLFLLETAMCVAGAVAGVPASLATFPPRVWISVDRLERPLREEIRLKDPNLKKLYYYKGL